MAFGSHGYHEEVIDHLSDLPRLLNKWPVTWVDVDGLGDLEKIKLIGGLFNLHQLALEDVVHVHQRAKVDRYGDQLFIVSRMLRADPQLATEQVSMLLGANFVLTFQEDHPGDCLEGVRHQIRTADARIRQRGTDYLAYALMDAMVDGYFPILEQYADRLEELEDEVLVNPSHETLSRIHEIKHELRTFRRVVWPQREAINALIRETSPLILEDTRVYMRDCYDHTMQVIDLLETYRELCADLTDMYLSSVSNRMNEVMKVLTVISTIFIPLSFVASLYGMNFDTQSAWNMPELSFPFGYPLLLLFMLVMTLGMLRFFYRRGWIGESKSATHSWTGKALPPAPNNGDSPPSVGSPRSRPSAKASPTA